MRRILLIDNYDSFTYNLLHSIEKNADTIVDVFRNDHLSGIDINNYDKVVLSPGPGLPHEAGELMSFIEANHQTIPILGICLGHQALGVCFGAELMNLPQPLKGKQLEKKILTQNGFFAPFPKKYLPDITIHGCCVNIIFLIP